MLLSITMIVKNEERNLPRAIASVQPLIDQGAELVIVDTGSTDRTVEIARAATRRVFDQPWTGNFSIHRNFSFRKCHGKWIFAIDADEELMLAPGATIDTIFGLLRKIPKEINTVALSIADIRQGKKISDSDSVRFFRAGSTIWKRAIHNKPEFAGKTVPFNGCYIKHYGYDLTPEQADAKAKRTIDRLLQCVEEDPGDFENHFYLSQAYAVFKDDEKNALKHAEIYIANRDKIDNFNPGIYFLVLNAYLRRGDLKTTKKFIDIALSHIPDSVDIFWCAIQYGVKSKNPLYIANAAQQFVLAFNNLEKYRLKYSGCFTFASTANHLAQALYYVVMSHFEHGVLNLKQLQNVMQHADPAIRSDLQRNIAVSLEKMELTSSLVENDKPRIILPGINNQMRVSNGHYAH